MQKNFWIILVLVVGGLFAILFATGGKQASNTTFEGEPLAVSAEDHVRGEGKANVEIIEFGDFACPGCGNLFPLLKQLEADYGEDITFVFRNFPLSNLHPNATVAHRAAEAAAKQGKFWEMHDLLYSQQQTWTRQSAGLSVSEAAAVFEGFAEQLELDMDQYRAAVASEEIFRVIDGDIAKGKAVGVTGTPSLFINGEEMPSLTGYEQLKGIVEDAIKASKEAQADSANTNTEAAN